MTPAPLDPTVGSLESFTAIIDALAAEHGAPRDEILRRLIEDLEGRIAVDRATIALLRRLEGAERRLADPAPDRVPRSGGRAA